MPEPPENQALDVVNHLDTYLRSSRSIPGGRGRTDTRYGHFGYEIMSGQTSLERAHALSAHASDLLHSSSCTPATLHVAMAAYQDAAGLFELSAAEVGDDESAKRTLQLLTTQNRKQARDVERRIHQPSQYARSQTSNPTGAQTNHIQNRREVPRRNSSPVPTRESPGLGLGAIARQAWPPPGVATRLSPSRGLPPFALRPPSSEMTPSDRPGPSRLASTSRTLDPILSPLHSSSSSSGTSTEIGESYINFGVAPDTLDPFSRFWGMLDNMLDDISNPVAFASAPIESVPGPAQDVLDTAKRKDKFRGMDRRKGKGKDREDIESESFYLVNKGGSSVPHGDEKKHRNRSPSMKTPEELALENENLRASLDKIAQRAHEVDVENKTLRSEAEERTRTMKTIISEVRREAQKAKHGQDLFRSQMLASATIPSPAARVSAGGRLEASRLAVPTANTDIVQSQRKRIQELEQEVQSLKTECETHRESATKYKERLDKIKANAKAKKEAKAKAEDEDNPAT